MRLIAHAAGDDSRALDNWSRLAKGRMAAQPAAPLRFALEPAFRTIHPLATQTTLQRQGDRLVGGMASQLRAIQGLLASGRLADAFRQVGVLLPKLKQEMPDVVGKLAGLLSDRHYHGRLSRPTSITIAGCWRSAPRPNAGPARSPRGRGTSRLVRSAQVLAAI